MVSPSWAISSNFFYFSVEAVREKDCFLLGFAALSRGCVGIDGGQQYLP